MEHIVTRKQALDDKLPLYYTGVPCVRGHLSYKRTLGACCVACEKMRERKPNTTEQNKKYNASLKGKETKRKLMRMHTPLYNARKKQRLPKWADVIDLWAIKYTYKYCPKGYDVDHIIPLNGDTVSGLHIFENMQWLKSEDNRAKSNKFDSLLA